MNHSIFRSKVNRTFDDFENSPNTNGSILFADVGNIHSNNAANYIPNENDINIVIDTSLDENNRNFIEKNHGDINDGNNATVAYGDVDLSIPMPAFQCERIADVKELQTYYAMNELNEYHPGKLSAASESLNNYIDLTEPNDQKCPNDDEQSDVDEMASIVVTETICHPTYDQISQKKSNDLDPNSVDDGEISVEEALRALDFAISGGESIFSDSEYDSSSDESPKEFEETILPKQSEQMERKSIDVIETVGAKDKFSENDYKVDIENESGVSNVEYSRTYVYQFAKELVDSVLEECTEKVSPMMHPVWNDENVPKNESHVSEDGKMQSDDFNDSMEDIFVVGKVQASTPCHKINVNCQREKNRLGVNLFHALDEVNESNLSGEDGVRPIQESQAHMLGATFELEPVERQLASTFVKTDDQTFNLVENQLAATFVKTEPQHLECIEETFNIESGVVKPQIDVPPISPTIIIDKEEVNSDDLTTITPMNTPIELNYVDTTWDQFVSKNMNKKCMDVEEMADKKQETIVNDALTIGNPKNPWFLHLPQSNDTFNMNDTEYSNGNFTDDESGSVEENAELLSLTFDALRKQLADVLPQASGMNFHSFFLKIAIN